MSLEAYPDRFNSTGFPDPTGFPNSTTNAPSIRSLDPDVASRRISIGILATETSLQILRIL